MYFTSFIVFVGVAGVQLLQIPLIQCFFMKSSPEALHNNGTVNFSILNNASHKIALNKEKDSTQCPNCPCGKSNRRIKRIVGGVDAEQNEFPWMVVLSLYNKSDGEQYFFCGAMIITKQHLLTAAHCVNNSVYRPDNPREITAWLGMYNIPANEPNKVIMSIDKIIQHPKYQYANAKLSSLAKNDIAILKLDNPILFNTTHIQPICLPKSDNQNYTGLISVASGWGRTEAKSNNNYETMHKVEIPIMSIEDCRKNYNNMFIEVTDDIICGDTTGGKDTCKGDSGGPLQMFDIQSGTMEAIGIISHGIGCARPEYPGFYTRIANYMSWVKENIDGECLCTS